MAGTKEAISNARLVGTIQGIAMLVAVPILILGVITSSLAPRSQWDIPVYVYPILVLYVAIAPLLMPMYERALAKRAARKVISNNSPFWRLWQFSNIRLTLACAPYCFGLLVFVFSHSLTWVLAFFPIGIFWSIRLWPTKRVLESYLQRIESHVPDTG